MAIISFNDKETKAFFESGKSTKIPKDIQKRALMKLDMLNASVALKDLQSPPSNRLEALSGNYKGYYSIRVNDKYRIIFQFDESKNEASNAALLDYH